MFICGLVNISQCARTHARTHESLSTDAVVWCVVAGELFLIRRFGFGCFEVLAVPVGYLCHEGHGELHSQHTYLFTYLLTYLLIYLLTYLLTHSTVQNPS